MGVGFLFIYKSLTFLDNWGNSLCFTESNFFRLGIVIRIQSKSEMTRRGKPKKTYDPPFEYEGVITRGEAHKLFIRVVEALEAEGKTGEEIGEMLGIKRATYFLWKKDKRYLEYHIWSLQKLGYEVEELGLRITSKSNDQK